MAFEFDQLPVEIMHHIQSFLSGKEAAQTSILSKLWFTAWSTRPILHLDESDFSCDDLFSTFCWETVYRYKELNLRAEKIILRMLFYDYYDCVSFADELIDDVLKLNVSEIELDVGTAYVLPAQLFAARSLTRLCVSSGKISERIDGIILCSRLTSLSLIGVSVTDDIVRNIHVGCPLIENLILCYCSGLKNVNVSKILNLVKLHVSGSVHVEFKDSSYGLPTHVPEFCYLHHLTLDGVEVSNDFFTEFSSRFPCLVDLTLENFHGYKDIQISSNSLRYVTLYPSGCKWEKLQFNVPTILRFIFENANAIPFPFLSFRSASKEWESHVKLKCFCHGVYDASWFEELRKLLTELRLSRITLSIIFFEKCVVSIKGVIPRFPVPVVENLIVCANLSETEMRETLIGLLKSCRPNFITECKSTWYSHDNALLQYLYKILMQYDDKDLCCTFDLKEVNVDQFDENLMQWQSIPVAKGEDALAILRDDKQMRLRFSWVGGE